MSLHTGAVLIVLLQSALNEFYMQSSVLTSCKQFIAQVVLMQCSEAAFKTRPTILKRLTLVRATSGTTGESFAEHEVSCAPTRAAKAARRHPQTQHVQAACRLARGWHCRMQGMGWAEPLTSPPSQGNHSWDAAQARGLPEPQLTASSEHKYLH